MEAYWHIFPNCISLVLLLEILMSPDIDRKDIASKVIQNDMIMHNENDIETMSLSFPKNGK